LHGPERVIGPERPQLHDRRRSLLYSEALDDLVEDDLLLGLVVTAQVADDLGHPLSVIAALHDEDPIVHDLHPPLGCRPHLPGIGDLRDPVGVSARRRELDAFLLVHGFLPVRTSVA